MVKWFIQKSQANFDIDDIEVMIDCSADAEELITEMSYHLCDDFSPEVTITLPRGIKLDAIKAQLDPITITDLGDGNYRFTSEIALLCDYNPDDESEYFEVQGLEYGDTCICPIDGKIRFIYADGHEEILTAEEIVNILQATVDNGKKAGLKITPDLEFMPETLINRYTVKGTGYYVVDIVITDQTYEAWLSNICIGYSVCFLTCPKDVVTYSIFLEDVKAATQNEISEYAEKYGK